MKCFQKFQKPSARIMVEAYFFRYDFYIFTNSLNKMKTVSQSSLHLQYLNNYYTNVMVSKAGITISN